MTVTQNDNDIEIASSGAGVDVQDEGTPVTGNPHTTMNFVGAGVNVTNAGGGIATVTIPGGGGGSNLGAGLAVFKDVSSGILRHRTLRVGGEVSGEEDPAGFSGEIHIRPVPPGHLNVRDFGAIPDYGTGRTGSITGGTAILIVSNATALKAGQIISIGRFAARVHRTILTLVGTTVTLTATVPNTITNGAVTIDNLAAFNAAIAAMSGPTSSLGERLVFHGKYYLSGTLHITKNLTLEGTTATFATHDPASQLAFPMGCDGLRFHTGGGAGRDNGPNGETGQAGFSHIYDFSVVCDDHNDFDIENFTGIAAGQQPTTLHLRYYNAGGPIYGRAHLRKVPARHTGSMARATRR